MLAWLPLLLLFLALAALAYWISNLLLYPPRQPLTRSPSQYGLEYEDVRFDSVDGLPLKGWWIPATTGSHPEKQSPAVTLLHPLFGNRHGYVLQPQLWRRSWQVEVDLLDLARRFRQNGFAVLLFDFRSHGDSAPGRCGGGFNEDQDVTAAVDYVFRRLESDQPNAAPRVGLVGFGLGACAAMAAVGREKGGNQAIRIFSGDSESATGWTEFLPANVKKLCFLAAIGPVSLGERLRGELHRMLPLLDRLVVPLVDRVCLWRGGYPLNGALLHNIARHVNVPVLLIQPGPELNGQPPGASEGQRLYAALPGPKRLEWIDPALSPMAAYRFICENPEFLLTFAGSNLF